jgi:predicted phage terminase large subunit-like protein
VYLLDVLRRRMEYPELKRVVRAHAAEWGAKNVLIEDKASGTQLCQELIQEGVHGIKKCQSKLDKTMRMHTVTSTIENGFVYVLEKAPWLSQYLHELVTFPNGKHDDQADSTSQALGWLKNFMWEPGILIHYRELALKQSRNASNVDIPKSMIPYLHE